MMQIIQKKTKAKVFENLGQHQKFIFFILFAVLIAGIVFIKIFGILKISLSVMYVLEIIVFLSISVNLLLYFLSIISNYLKKISANNERVIFPSTPNYSVSIIVPAFNEERVISQTVYSLLRINYTNLKEIICVDDGSSDKTYDVLVEQFSLNKKIKIVRKTNGGKASALNEGIKQATGKIIVVIDADTVIMPSSLNYLLKAFSDKKVGAVSGQMCVGNEISSSPSLVAMQSADYLLANNIDRKGLSLINCMTVIPGAIGAYRSHILRKLGGYDEDTLAEDADLTIRILKLGYKIVHEPKAIALTEAPDCMKDFIKQRMRWCYGKTQVLWKHRYIAFHKQYGLFGWLGYPIAIVSQVIIPPFLLIIDLMPILLLGLIAAHIHYHNLSKVIWQSTHTFIFLVLLFQLIYYINLLYASRLLEKKEQKISSINFICSQFFLRGMSSIVCLITIYKILSGKKQQWNKLDRLGTVNVQISVDN